MLPQSNNKRFLLALAASVAIHLALLLFKINTPPEILSGAERPPSKLDVRLATPDRAPQPAVTPQPAPPKQKLARTPRPPPRIQSPPVVVAEAEKTWSQTEKSEMNRFLNELDTPPKPRSGAEIMQNALAMARTFAKEEEKGDELAEITQRLRAANIEPLNLELYYEALFRKLNRSAAMVKNNSREVGTEVAVVRVVLNPNGSVKSFSVLQTADQQAEIAYIKTVVERAAPFPAFPADIRKATDALILQICIQPKRFAAGSGPLFTRIARGQSCREEG